MPSGVLAGFTPSGYVEGDLKSRCACMLDMATHFYVTQGVIWTKQVSFKMERFKGPVSLLLPLLLYRRSLFVVLVSLHPYACVFTLLLACFNAYVVISGPLVRSTNKAQF